MKPQIIFDMKKTTLFLAAFLFAMTAFAQKNRTVFFDLNYDTAETIAPVHVENGRTMKLSDKPFPARDGYRFGGWYTDPSCQPDQEWLFGSNSSFFAPATDSMKVERSMILYAKWVSPKPVRTIEDLDAIREDLYGWYVLENDIDISGMANWIPIGKYESNYEFAPGEWWTHAFKGCFDGQGHTIRGLRISELLTDKSGLFGAVANGEITNLNMEDSRLVFSAPSPYVAPLAGILKQDDNQTAAIRNCQVTGTLIQVTTTNDQSTFHSFTGLCGGAWGGDISRCKVSGKMVLNLAGTGGGELYVGPFLGEAYNDTADCTSDYDINLRITETQPKDSFKAYVGGLQASATNVNECVATGSIRVSGKAEEGCLYIGGLVGSERYGTVSNSISHVKISVINSPSAQVGGIVGEFNANYGLIGAAFGITTTLITGCTYVGKPSFRNVSHPVFGEIAGAGEPEAQNSPWGLAMNYKIENCAYKKK